VAGASGRLGRLRSVCLVALVALAAPAQVHAAAAPSVPNAKAAIVIDGRNGEVMFAKHPRARREIASTTKLMTALLTLERAEPGEVFTAAARRPSPVESQIGLASGERMKVADLFKALMLESANDAAETLAEGISGSQAAFVAAMNRRARQLGLSGTSYANPIGLDDPNNYSTARDLAKLTFDLMQERRFARVVDMPSAQLHSGAKPRTVDNRNLLIGAYPFVNGVKTGHTSQAGYLLVGSARSGIGGRVISVVMGEPSEAGRDADTLELLRWGLSRFHRVRVLDRHRALAHPKVEYFDERARLVPQRGLVLTLRDGEHVGRHVVAPDQVSGPLAARTRKGSVSISVDGERVRRVRLVTADAVPAAGTLRVLTSVLGVPLTVLAVLAILIVAALVILRWRVRLKPVKR
jgi:D-alanyl-D-alanine carboxypeptidase (penicillin-binding protein 5/6)